MRNQTLRTCVASILSVTLFFTTFASAREWTRASDGKKIQATFAGVDGENVLLKLANGQTVPVPKSSLSPADHVAIEQFAKIGDNSRTKELAANIDKLLAQTLVKKGFTGFNPALPDDLFARRVYLDIIGRIPTREEFLRFAENPRTDKRGALIDELLSHPGRASHMFNYFADMYRINSGEFNQGVRMEPYAQWWKDSLAENKHYDEMVTDMITAQGNVGQNPASGFLLRDAGMEFDAFSNFAQVMIGIDISCAQCHDHPFDDWTMSDFYEMAAFFNSTQRTLRNYGMMGGGRATMPNAPEDWVDQAWAMAESKGIDRKDPQSSRQFGYFISFLGMNLTDVEGMEMPVPVSVADSAEKLRGEIFSPRTLTKPEAKKGGKTRRESVAEWLTSPENPRFAMAIANRMWDRAFGRPLVGPVHDVTEMALKDMGQPQVLTYVTKVMREVNYDLREFSRILYNTRAYQSIATEEEPSWADAYYFQGPVLRRMRAEQTWDSFMVLAHGDEIDQKKGRDGSFLKEVLNINFNEDSMDDVWAKYEAYDKIRGARAGAAVIAEPGTLNPIFAQSDDLRASEMEQPAPPAHTLDTFGQSDRLITDEHNYDGSVPQVLALMNGPITSRLTGSSSKLVDDLEDLDGPDDKVRGVFHTVLSRFPTDDELNVGMGLMSEYGDDGVRDLGWALLNSPEFLYIQ